MERPRIILSLLVIGLTFAAHHQCFGDTRSDLEAIRELFLTLERGYEEHDLEKYMSVFSDAEYEYISDMATPDDPTDDVHVLQVEEERRSAERVFNAYEILDLELTEPEITIDDDSAKAKNEIRIVFLVPEKPVFPEIYYAATSNVYSMKKPRGEWKIVRWEQHETPSDELAARRQQEIEGKSVETLIQDLASDSMVTWAMAISDLRKASETNVAPLIEALHHPDKNVRYRIIWVLAGTRNEAAVKALADILRIEENDADIRAAAAKALTGSSDPMVDKALFIAARRGEPKVKSAACLALAVRLSRGINQVREFAVNAIQDRDENVRQELVKSLGFMMSSDGADLLEARLKDRNESRNVRLAALESLKGLQLESSLRLFRAVLMDRAEVMALRVKAARALGEAKDRQALTMLMDVSKNETEPSELRREAADALGKIQEQQRH